MAKGSLNPNSQTLNSKPRNGQGFYMIVNPRKLEHGFRMINAGIPILYLKGMRAIIFQLSGFYYINSIIGFTIGTYKKRLLWVKVGSQL